MESLLFVPERQFVWIQVAILIAIKVFLFFGRDLGHRGHAGGIHTFAGEYGGTQQK